MSSDALQFLGVVVTALGIFGGVLLAQRNAAKKTHTDVAQGLIDQLQEERGDIRSELNAVKLEQVAMVEANRARDERERIRDDYIQELRNHIRNQLPPPPPPWPEGLRRG